MTRHVHRTDGFDVMRDHLVEALRLALLLLVVVACVTAATRPVTPRRRSQRTRQHQPSTVTARTVPSRSRSKLYRNRWDRRDLARGIGADFADPEIADR